MENKQIDELPLVVGGAMRSPFDLLTITPQAKGSGTTLQIAGDQAAAPTWNCRKSFHFFPTEDIIEIISSATLSASCHFLSFINVLICSIRGIARACAPDF